MAKGRVVIINGLGGVGKSEFIKCCKKEFCPNDIPMYGIEVAELSTVDFVKDVAKYCGWEGTKETKDRIFLSDLKIALAKWKDIPITYVFKNIDAVLNISRFAYNTEHTHIFFINSREPEDNARIYDIAKEKGYEPVRLLITNPNKESNEVPELIDGINNMVHDYEVCNDGTIKDLSFKAVQFVHNILGDDKAVQFLYNLKENSNEG